MKKLIVLILLSLILVGCAKSDAQLTKEGEVVQYRSTLVRGE